MKGVSGVSAKVPAIYFFLNRKIKGVKLREWLFIAAIIQVY